MSVRRRLAAALDALESPEASVLIRLALDEPFNVRQFYAATQASPYTAKQVHARLEQLGVIRTTYTGQGAVQAASITLTPWGRRVAEALLAVEDVMAEGLARDSEEKPRSRRLS